MSPYFDRTGKLRTHTPMSGVDVVCSPAGDHSGAKLFATQPAWPAVAILRVDTFLSVIDVGRGAEPHVVVQIRWNWHLRFFVARRVARKSDIYLLEFADAAIAHKFGGVAELFGRALLAADLEFHSAGRSEERRVGNKGRCCSCA